MISTNTSLPVLKAKDYASDQDIRWCPGCGDYAILNHVKKTLATLQASRENSVFVSGIGCSSRFPYYMGTYGFHSIHGRAPAIAAGVKSARPDLDVWMVTGDGDGFSIGTNHTLHFLRRNFNVNILLFNNQIYGLTKGQYSPTSEQGKRTKSTPLGSLETPFRPTTLALAAEATFVARGLDVDKHLGSLMQEAAEHKGSSFIEIYQDCNIFNHGAFFFATKKDTQPETTIRVVNGEPLIYGADSDKGLIWKNGQITKVVIGEEAKVEDLIVHDETDPVLAYALSRLRYPDFPEPLGVIYRVEEPCYEDELVNQVAYAQKAGNNSLDDLLNMGDVYEVD